MSRIGLVLLTVACAALVGCVGVPIAGYQPVASNVAVVKAAPIAPIALGEFSLAAGAAPGIDKRVQIRGVSYASPVGDSFALYLREAVLIELRAGRKYDPAATTVLSGQLLRNSIGGVFTGSGVLGAKFQVRRGADVLYDKELAADAVFKTTINGQVGLMEGTGQYLSLYSQLLARLFKDEEFQRACLTPQ